MISWMFLSNHLDYKYLKTAFSLKFLHPISLSYPPGQQLQKQPQIQRTEVSTNHVLIYFEEVRFSVTLLDLGAVPGVPTNQYRFQLVLFTYTGEGEENNHIEK